MPMTLPTTNATATKANQPQIAFLRCFALHRPARAAKVFECMKAMSLCDGHHAIRAAGVSRVGLAPLTRNERPLRSHLSPSSSMPALFVDALSQARDRTLALVAHLDGADLERQVDPLMSP